MVATGTAGNVEQPPNMCNVCAHVSCTIHFEHDIYLLEPKGQPHTGIRQFRADVLKDLLEYVGVIF